MRSLYSSPLRVYLCLAGLAIAGILSGLSLPISLFPNSEKPRIMVGLDYGSRTANEFVREYGTDIEERFRAINTNGLRVENVEATYNRGSVEYDVIFDWGSPTAEALQQINQVLQGFSGRFPPEVRNSQWSWVANSKSGFLSISFWSATRSLDDVYDILDKTLSTQLGRVEDADLPHFYNPQKKDIQIEINPERMASLQLLPKDLSKAIENGLYGSSGGSLATADQPFPVQMPRSIRGVEDIARLPVKAVSGTVIHLGDVARIDYAAGPGGTRSYKTDGAASIILWARPKPGGNVKRMSEDIIHLVEAARPRIPADIQYKIVVDPSEFIRSAIRNVMREVLLGGLLSVVVLFLFVGSLKNTVTAAIEIPLSMVLAFIPMKMAGMSLNLISLAGLALSAGMNVDASVVVMENIFRRFEGEAPPISPARRIELVLAAVKEVRFSVIASTIASLVVFIPLAFTSKLTNAVLGDLAKAVVFSHGFSAFVALILVPTVRLHLMTWQKPGAKALEHAESPIERWIHALEEAYGRALGRFVASRARKTQVYGGLVAALVLLLVFALPRLPKEIIGKPDTDWITVDVSVIGATMYRQTEAQADELISRLHEVFGERIRYTYSDMYSVDHAWIMIRVRDKREVFAVEKEMEEKFRDSPLVHYWIGLWNPAELPIPDPPAFRLALLGGTPPERVEATEDLRVALDQGHAAPRVWAEPDAGHADSIVLRPNLDRWAALDEAKLGISPADLSDMVRVATQGKEASIKVPIDGKPAKIMMRYPESYLKTVEDIAALPVGTQGRLLPLRGLVQISIEAADPIIYRENGREMNLIVGRLNGTDGGSHAKLAAMERARGLVAKWEGERRGLASGDKVAVSFLDEERELNEALVQLSVAVALSVALIFVTLVIQFGSLMNAMLVLVAIPLGLIGVLSSLSVFGSTLSLNSVLGVILLNGIAVANSIILVDFMNGLVKGGMSAPEAAVEAGKKRLRPILITSLTTILAILPVAFGLGEGGRILQPLGIAVAGGLWVSMGFTLFVVPALQAAYLGRRKSAA